MNSIKPFSILNRNFYISISNKCHESFKKIVDIAPQESQWFNTVNELYDEDGELICLELGDQLYIPEQICSATEVDTSPTMMMDFYKELLKSHTPEETNEIISSMNCWSHSHVNMSVNPSGQDVSQFTQFVKQSQDQQCNKFQIMLIHNKKGDYYSRVFDPYTKLIYEGIPVYIDSEFDLSYIEEAAKVKFKKKALPSPLKNPYVNSSKFTDLFSFSSSKAYSPLEDEEDLSKVNEALSKDLLNQIYHTTNLNTKVKLSKKDSVLAYSLLTNEFDQQELLWFYFLISGNKDKIPKFSSLEKVDHFFLNNQNVTGVKNFIIDYFNKTADTLAHLHEIFYTVHSLTDAPTINKLKEIVEDLTI